MTVRNPAYAPLRLPTQSQQGSLRLPWQSLGSGNAALDIRASVGTSTSPTSPGPKAVPVVGFTPKAVLDFTNWNNATGAATEATFGFGAALSTSSRASIAVSSKQGQPASLTHRRHSNAHLLTECYGGNVSIEADLGSMDANGFTRNWSTLVPYELFINHIALGGADLQVSLTQHQMNGTNTAESFAHGLSGEPTALLLWSAVNSNAPANTDATIAMSIGAWAGGNQFGAGIRSDNGQTTTKATRVLSTSSAILWPDFSGSFRDRSMAINSVDSTNVNVIYPDTTVTYAPYFWMLAIRGAKCQVGTIDCSNSTSPLPINTPGITPKLFLPVFVANGITNLNAVQSSLIFSIGASDGTNNVSCGISDYDGRTTTSTYRYQRSSQLMLGWEGAYYFEGAASFSGESVILTPTNAQFGFGQGAYLIIGN